MYKAQTIAKWFIEWASSEDADLSNLKLQKLLYYAQGHHLGRFKAALFGDKIQAWAHGPVVPAVYRRYKAFNREDIVPDEEFDWNEVDRNTTDFLIEVWEAYGKFGAWQLRNMTHAEDPWKSTWSPEKSHVEIPTSALQRWFSEG